MNPALEFFEALIKAALPIGSLSYGMTWWALRRGLIKQTAGVHALNSETKALAKQKKQKKQKKHSQEDTPDRQA
jgi:hypothetical protein